MDALWDVVCGTGHRTLTRPDNEPWVREKLLACAEWLRDKRGCVAVVSGMALGLDMWLADAVAQTPGLELWAYLPFQEQAARWKVADRREWERLCGLANLVRVVGQIPTGLPANRRSGAVNRLLYGRNIEMLDVSRAVIAGWETGRLDGGTAGALLEAAERGMPGVHLDPLACTVRSRLPAVDQLTRQALYHRDCGHVAQVAAVAVVGPKLAGLRAAGRHEWCSRPARPRETRSDGCPVCRPTVVNGVAA